MDRIPPSKLDRSKEMEHQAKALDVAQRAQAARPVLGGADTLRAPSDGATDRLRSPSGFERDDGYPHVE